MSWINPNGYECVLLQRDAGRIYDEDQFLFRLLTPPLQWLCTDGNIIEPCRKAVTSIDARQFETDLGSVPWFASWIISRRKFARAYAFHDIAYRWGFWWGVNGIDGSPYKRFCTRSEADAMLYEMCLADGASKAQARAIWIGIRAGGWYKWNEYRRADNKTATQ